ncbi:hypothetical protein OH76DRAFT_145068 [Lentinus brumalis]|uniref:Uncharacterized protein n=1 Tax=Lentinus brumalis TaxID=2498619 RepID=A0A371CP75_9APHY|nr:hypothetical protein OH76DRAFT_145068 [Polyporus brumalis]
MLSQPGRRRRAVSARTPGGSGRRSTRPVEETATRTRAASRGRNRRRAKGKGEGGSSACWSKTTHQRSSCTPPAPDKHATRRRSPRVSVRRSSPDACSSAPHSGARYGQIHAGYDLIPREIEAPRYVWYRPPSCVRGPRTRRHRAVLSTRPAVTTPNRSSRPRPQRRSSRLQSPVSRLLPPASRLPPPVSRLQSPSRRLQAGTGTSITPGPSCDRDRV